MANEPAGPWAKTGAAVLLAAFEQHRMRYAGITARARRHFERGDWIAGQRDAVRRLDLYGESVREGVAQLGSRLGALADDRETWSGVRAAYGRTVEGWGDAEL